VSWNAILEGRVWEASAHIRGGWPLRTVAVELRGGGVAVLSPTRGLDIEALRSHAGEIRFLVASNHFHNLGVRTWLDACPKALPVASKVALPRLTKKVDVPWTDLDELEGALADDTTLLVPEGTASGEVWLSVERKDERVWIVCDAFFNLRTLPVGPLGLFCRATKTGPGLSVGRTWKYLQVGDRAAYKRWLLAQLKKAPPTVLVPAHGEIARGNDLGATLTELVERRL
jgi:hypothetical protein